MAELLPAVRRVGRAVEQAGVAEDQQRRVRRRQRPALGRAGTRLADARLPAGFAGKDAAVDAEPAVTLFERATKGVEVFVKRPGAPAVVAEDGDARAPAVARQQRERAQHLAARQPFEQPRQVGLAGREAATEHAAQERPQPRPAGQRRTRRQAQRGRSRIAAENLRVGEPRRGRRPGPGVGLRFAPAMFDDAEEARHRQGRRSFGQDGGCAAVDRIAEWRVFDAADDWRRRRRARPPLVAERRGGVRERFVAPGGVDAQQVGTADSGPRVQNRRFHQPAGGCFLSANSPTLASSANCSSMTGARRTTTRSRSRYSA